MTQKDVKCLAVGDVNGEFALLIKKVGVINAKSGPFDLLFCVGEFFGPHDAENKKMLDGGYELPIPTYILGPCCPSTAEYYPEEGAQLTPSLTFLGRKGILYTADGLTIGYCSGIDGQTANAFQFVEDDIDDMLLPIRTQSGFLGVDVLLTSVWPSDVAKHSINQPTVEQPGSKSISRLAAGLKPRYHFAGKGGHFERSPYRNHRVLLEAAQHVSRFIGLSPVGKKEKWIYAFSIKPMRKLDRPELTKQPGNTTEFPFMDVLQEYVQTQMKKQQAEQQGGSSQFFFDSAHYSDEENEGGDHGGRRGKRGGDRGPPAKKKFEPRPAENCWFCLSNVDAERHLVINVGSSVYVCLPKGGVNDLHVMVLSIGHVQSLVSASNEVREEVAKYRDAFTLMCDKMDRAVCCWERNYKTSHLDFEMIAIPRENGKALRLAFMQAADKYGLEFCFMKEGENVWDLATEGTPYFYCELPDGTRMFSRSMKDFPLHFAREVVASEPILNCADKVEWKSCVLGKEKEIKVATKLKEQFKPFDFNADSDSDDD